MKRNSKQSGSGGRLRLGLLMASVAAFLLVPVASAFADVPAEVQFAGEGAGWVYGTDAGNPEEAGVPPVECHWNGTEIDVGMPSAGECKTTAKNTGIGGGSIIVKGEHDAGSLLQSWEVDPEGGLVAPLFGCNNPVTAQTEQCTVLAYTPTVEIKITADFEPEATPVFWALTATKTGGGEGWVTSEDAGHALNCGLPCGERTASFEEGTVTLHAYGKQFTGWSGCTNEPTARQCEVNLEGDTTVEAEFLAPTGKLLTAKKVGGGQGWVTSLDAEHKLNCGLACPTERTVEFASGPVELRAYGSQFQGWTNCAGGVSGYQNRVCTMELNANETAEVEFE